MVVTIFSWEAVVHGAQRVLSRNGRIALGQNFFRLRMPECTQGFANWAILGAQNRRGKQRRVDGSGFSDGQRAYRNAARHLRDGKKRIEPLEHFRFHGDAQHRKHRFRRRHARKMRCAACPRNDHFNTAFFGGRRIFEKEIRGTVSRNHAGFISHAEIAQCVRGVLHGLPIGRGTHDDADQRRTRFRRGTRFSYALGFRPKFEWSHKIERRPLSRQNPEEVPFYGLFQRDATFARFFHTWRSSPTR